MTFKSFLKKVQKTHHYPSIRAFAAALGVDPTRLSRGTPFDVRRCLLLAQVTGENPTGVLKAAGKGELAALIEALYNTPAERLGTEETELLTAFRAIPDAEARQSLIVVAQHVAGSFGTGSGQPSGPHSPGTAMPPPKEPRLMSPEPRRARGGA